ncbi:glycoside hydrolase family 16 protein [Phyllobacterium sp. 21LDTY02-6]|uniref:glycoside hydrolase family 16 protein n=1 Tax=Phyllobacterium sp. 21LDTY02-6 TaxID=2944903 RepID=UPI00202082D4|nr:glycoside hydrolase family 16 protein [Phyllobacterium sp. 21LDTY02-6]MCO4317990.1 glycoside hydrolase family 16 protein [Phyllobacterium sp. 21LDTY02-6]
MRQGRSELSRRSFLGLAGFGIASAGLLARPSLARALCTDVPTVLQGVPGHWQISFNDSFNDNAGFDERWIKVTDSGGETKSVRKPANVALSSSGLSLKLGRNDNDKQGKRPFTGGYVRTRDFRQCYGYFECDMRIANEPGVNNAFWLTSVPESEGDKRFELDVVEAKYPSVVQVTARQWLPIKKVLSTKFRPRRKLADDFHRYAMLWSEDQFQFFFDDRKIFEAPNDFAHTPAQLLFSNAVASFAGKDDGDVNGAATSIRSIRVFQNTEWQQSPVWRCS